ncbi:maleylacetoacetate isomerase [Dokdonella sp.]|uniref:maleylacetoacetate isomerase n=1 Tax=Dokdonella sp. TaxID=2291710 RepID=UPI001B021B88|nr:maleylacetoacetate isomerase [Dokdonella sp.]MBO9664591.1 maleylacetoacetate isomerase [Dokdonella sp.]
MSADAEPDDFTLHDYWRSSASYRVRIGLNLKGLRYAQKPVHLVRNGGEQHGAEHHALNPMDAVPVLVHGANVIRQSLAILEYLDEVAGPAAPRLLPVDPLARARVRSLALLIACDVHPLNNLRAMQYLERELGAAADVRETWMRHWMAEGFRAFEALLATDAATGLCCHGDTPTLADACLIPQVYNANRFGVDLAPFPTIRRVNEHCLSLPAFDAARPERQPDAA